MTPKMEAALEAAESAGVEGLAWTCGGWQRPGEFGVFHSAVIVSRLVYHHQFLSEHGPKSGPRQRRVITEAGLAYLRQKRNKA